MNKAGNPAFGKTITGATPRKPKPPAPPHVDRASAIRKADETIAQHLDDLVDVVIQVATKNKDKVAAMYLIDRVLGPTAKVSVERDDQLTRTLEQLTRALHAGAGEDAQLGGPPGVLRDGGVPAEREPGADS